MRSHAILRTNVGLTTNAKIMVSSSYSLYVDAIISNTELSSSKYKRKEFNSKNYWDEILPNFFKKTPANTAYFIKDDLDNKNMSKDFSKQYDDIYEYGARNIIENKDYTEEYEYFAPLHISKTGLPTNFVIFRIDGPGIINLTKENFRSEILEKLKCVKIFDMTKKSPLGEWLETNITTNKSFPESSLYIDFRNLEFSSWIGIDYEDGGYSEKSFMLESTLKKEQTFQDFEKLILDGYKNNKVVYPHILNLSFLFDDTPATPTSIRTWSLNRYLGFYMDSLEFVKNVSPYILPKVKGDVIIDNNNLIYSPTSTNPFEESFKKLDDIYIEIGGEFYKIEKYLEQQPTKLSKVEVSKNTFEEKPNQSFITKYKIISNIFLTGRQSEINKNIITVEHSNGLNKLSNAEGSTFILEGYEEADIWLIEIDGLYHNFYKASDGEFYINTDYAFQQSLDKFEYYINDPDIKFRKKIDLKVDAVNAPKQFKIYKCKFTDIKDFDTDIVDTEYSKFEYLYKDKLTETDETKMFATNHNSNTIPKDLDDFRLAELVVNIPTTSEYTANSEIFRLINGDLNFLWKKNSQRLKWGFQNSSSSNDYPYLLNNSFLSEDFNRTTNTYNPSLSRTERNLDYFLTINPDNFNYSHHSLHVVDNPTVTFEYVSSFNNLTKLMNVSDVGQFSINDIVLITTTNSNYNTSVRIQNIIYENSYWNITLNLNYVFISGTLSGTVKNLTRNCFSLDKYLNVGYDKDYFDYFFSKKTEFQNGEIIKNTKKYSYFNLADNITPNITLFRGIKFKIWDVSDVKIKDRNIEAINLKSSNKYDGYKFAILLSKNNFRLNRSDNNELTLNYSSNQMKWLIIDRWKHEKIYNQGDLINFKDIIYVALSQSQIIEPEIFPYNSSDWGIYSLKSIFWNPNVDGSDFLSPKNNMFELGKTIFNDINVVLPPLVFNYKEYYYSKGISGNNFWIPGQVYNSGQVVLFEDKIWISSADNNSSIPSLESTYVVNGDYFNWWNITTTHSTIWTSVELWNEQQEYLLSNSVWDDFLFTKGHYVIYEDVVYVAIADTSKGVIPPLDLNWKRVYSLVQDTNYSYSFDFNQNYNPIIQMNNRLYLCRDNGTLSLRNNRALNSFSTLENGINIYINNKWKNVLINIYVNDNTYTTIEEDRFGSTTFKKDRISNTKRDDIYTDIYSKLSANNFMNAINDLSNYYDFSDKIRYVIINEDGTKQIFDFNDLNSVKNLPTLLSCEGPDEFLVQTNSLIVEPVNLSVSEIKPKRQLKNGRISSLSELNYYSDSNLATIIKTNISDPVKVPNFSNLKNNLYNNLFRHSGNYSPIFHTIELFGSSTLTQSIDNYKFDTDLTYFGEIKERIISKINREKNILKLKDKPDIDSVYPMLDEFGYHTITYFIFKSTWDLEYHVECQEVSQTEEVTGNQSLQFSEPSNQTNTINLNLL